jgi:hypothetical protein
MDTAHQNLEDAKGKLAGQASSMKDGAVTSLSSMKDGVLSSMKSMPGNTAGALIGSFSSIAMSDIHAQLIKNPLSDDDDKNEEVEGVEADGGSDIIIVDKFMLMCQQAVVPAPMPVTVPPGGLKINNMNALVANGIPLTVSMGQCKMLPMGPGVFGPCCTVVIPNQGAKKSKFQGAPVATQKGTKFLCGMGQELKLIMHGQTGKPVETA